MITIKIMQTTNSKHKKGIEKELVLECQTVLSDFNEHETLRLLFAIEVAANAQGMIPMRVHISETFK